MWLQNSEKKLFFNFQEPSSRDPMVESSSSEESSVTNEPVCTQLLTQLNTAYQHLAPDAQAIVSIHISIYIYIYIFFYKNK